ncbi:uncharacterized protein LOC130933925 [Arachis stenosperma]|uniref:uncharacterized protein LOC130933925 n=1 Tax=Arachis stenosperma TaxID=217475 RepID=UPI0025ABD459|nr:uncharacterized protein LOC130933925 [Arachis stenosperma]
MKGPEQRYSSPEKYCLALVYISQRYRQYFQAHQVEVVSKNEGLRFLIEKPMLIGRMSRWALLISEYDVKLVTPTTIKSQALADLLSICPEKATIEELPDQIPGTIKTVYACNEEETWTFMFDGTPSNPQGGVGVVLTDSHGRNLSFMFRLDFSCTNNKAEYKALILGLKMAQEVENKHADALATLGSRVTIQNGQHALEHRVAESPAREEGMFVEGKTNDWRMPIHKQLRTRNITKETRGFFLLNGQIFRKSNDGLLMKCVGEEEGKEKAEQLHGATCEEEGPGLYRRLQRSGIYWPKMKFHCDELQASCKACQETKESMQICNVHNWQQPIVEYLNAGVLPSEKIEAERLKKRSKHYFLRKGELFKKSFTGEMLKCVRDEEKDKVLEEVHQGVCGRHQGGRALWYELIKIGYYWPKMKEDAINWAKRCLQCQKHANLIHAPSVQKNSLKTPYPFHTWAVDFVGPINPPSMGKKWILVTTESFTKWVEAVAVRETNAEAVVRFIKENIICRFGLPSVLVSDNGTHFVNQRVWGVLEQYQIKHHKSSPYYRKAMARTTRHGTTGVTPFSLVYGVEAVLPTEIEVPTARMLLDEARDREAELQELEEKREVVGSKMEEYHRRLALAYDKHVQSRVFLEGDLVLKSVDAVMRKMSLPKWAPK